MEDARLLAAWEDGLDQHPLDRALTLLLADRPQATRAELAQLAVGERDARLLAFYRDWFGPRLKGRAICPQCAVETEFDLEIDSVLGAASASPGGPCEVESGGRRLRLKPVTTLDLAAALACEDEACARRLLAGRCVQPLDGGETPEGAALDEVMPLLRACDPLGEVRVGLTCPACGREWSELIDAPGFVWARVDLYAQRLLREVHGLASVYGWSETEILTLSPARRGLYLELAGV